MSSREEMRKGRVKGAKVVFARTYISSAKGEQKTLKIGYSYDIVVYLNRQKIFSGKNALSYRGEGAFGTFGVVDQVDVHLNRETMNCWWRPRNTTDAGRSSVSCRQTIRRVMSGVPSRLQRNSSDLGGELRS